MKTYLYKYKGHLIFFIIFSLSFLIISNFFVFFLPFIIGILISVVMYPIFSFMKRKLSFKPAFSASVITFFIFSLIILLISTILYFIIKEAIHLYIDNKDFFNNLVTKLDLSSFIKNYNFDSAVLNKVSGTAVSFVKIIPIVISLFILSFFFTFCFINNVSDIKNIVFNKLSDNYKYIFNKVIDTGYLVFKRFLKSYLILYFLTFIESLFIFNLVEIRYTFVFAFLTAVSDILPILGPGTVYLPIAIVNVFNYDYLDAVTLLIFWLITIIIRQIIEPKIISDTIKIHPLIFLIGLYFSIVSSNVWVLFYLLFITVSYNILIKSDVLQPIFLKKR